jgi:hypothetical protein
MKLRLMLLVLAMIAVFGAVEYRLSNPLARQQLLASDEYPLALAPSFAGYDQQMHLFRLKSYVGRQAMFVVFCGENKKADTDPNVSHLVSHLDELNSKGIRVVVVTPNLPQENRKIDLPDDFDLISDFEQTKTGELYKAHKAFRSFDSKSKKPLAKVFFIDRAGNVPVNEGVPVGLLNPDSDIDRLLDVASE